MRAIAREAGVGIATLYRHFPTKESLVDAVYRSQVARLTAGASRQAIADASAELEQHQQDEMFAPARAPGFRPGKKR